jgi:hypothetical protein
MLPKSINKKITEKQIPEEWRMEDSETKLESDEEEITEDEDEDEDYRYLINNKNKENFKIINNLYKELLPDEEQEYKCYSYQGENLLRTNLEEQILTNEKNGLYPRIYIYAYCVNTTGKYPFLQYFFNKNKNKNKNNKNNKINKEDEVDDDEDEELLSVPQFVYSDVLEVMSKSISILTMICLSYRKELLYNFKGYYQEDNGSLLLFFDCSKLNIEKVNITKYTDLVLVLMDEIINYKKMGNIKIEETTVNFFNEHTDFLYLTDKQQNIYEIPTVVYSGCLKKKSDFILTFGISPLTDPVEALMGNYFYFTDYEKAKNMKESESLIRFAIFLKDMRVKLNDINDYVDDSQITEHLLLTLNKKSKEYHTVKFQLRLSDRDGLWAISHDSAYIGRVELDDGSYFEKGPLWVLKNYEQQIPLSIFC